MVSLAFASFDDHARGGRAGHHRDVSGHRNRHPAERIRVRRLCGAAAHHDADLDLIAVRRRRRLRRRCEPQLQPAQSHRRMGDGGVAAGLANHSDLRGAPGAVHRPAEGDRVHHHSPQRRWAPPTQRTRYCRPRRWACCRAAQSMATWSTTTRRVTWHAVRRCWGYVSAWTKELHRLGLPRRDVCQPVFRRQTPLGGLHLTCLCSPGRNMDRALGRKRHADRLGWHPQCAVVQSSAWEAVPRRP